MDRGVKIAIFAASIISLGFGLIWDQVLSHARVALEPESADTLAGETMEARMGSRDIARMEVAPDLAPQFQAAVPDATEVEPAPGNNEPPPATGWTEYTVKNGDSWWRIAHVEFKDRGLSSEDVQKANPGVVLRPGSIVKIPVSKESVGSTAGQSNPTAGSSTPASSAPPAAGATEYIVKEGDSWWKIAHTHFKDRGLDSDDLQKANPGVALRPGVKLKIPAGS